MTDKELEAKVKQAFDAAAPNVFDDVLADCDGAKSKVVALAKGRSKKRSPIRRVLAVAAMLALLICAAAGGAYANTQANLPVSIVTVDVNPSIELKLNSRDKVLDAAALNGDGQNVLDGLELRGEKLDAALQELVDALHEDGYLSGEKNSVLITVENSDAAQAEKLRDRVDEVMEKAMDTADFNGTVISQVLEKTEELTEKAKELAISPGKLQLVSEISRGSGYSPEELAALNISDLNLLRLIKNIDIGDIDVSGGDNVPARAVRAAAEVLETADIGDELPDVSIDADVKNGGLVCSIGFSFAGRDYSYELSPDDGSIESCARQIAADLEALCESYADEWESWGESTGNAWEAWGEAQGEAWENWGEGYADAWEAWAENYADQWEEWAEQHPDEWKSLIEQYPEKWEAWAKEHSDEWNTWLESNADSLGELGRFLKSWTSLFKKWWS